MGTKVILDTSVLIGHIRNKNKHDTLFSKIIHLHKPLISEITAFELLIGKTVANQDFIESILKNIEHLPFNHSSKLKAVEIYVDLKKRNKLIQPPDIFIAATALSLNIPLATHNIKHFSRIEGLQFFSYL